MSPAALDLIRLYRRDAVALRHMAVRLDYLTVYSGTNEAADAVRKLALDRLNRARAVKREAMRRYAP